MKRIILIIAVLVLFGINSYCQNKNANWKLKVDSISNYNDTLFIYTRDLFIQFPFGEYPNINVFRNNNPWIKNFEEKVYYNKGMNWKVYCYCGDSLDICVSRNNILLGTLPYAMLVTKQIGYTKTSLVRLKHGIRVGISKDDFFRNLGLKIEEENKPNNIILLTDQNVNQYYIFKDNILIEIVFEDPLGAWIGECNNIISERSR